MKALVNSVALLATLIALIAAVMSDHGLFTACKRALISYFAFYVIASLLVLAYRGGVVAETRKDKPVKRADQHQNGPYQQPGSTANTPQEAS